MDVPWTEEDIKSLLQNILQKKKELTKRFIPHKSSDDLDFDELKINDKPAEECKEAFDKITTWVYKQMTINDVVLIAKSKIEQNNIPVSMIPNAPKRPLTAFFLFTREKYEGLKKKHPNMSIIELNVLAKEKWDQMSEEKKSKYFGEYQAQKKVYDAWKSQYMETRKKSRKVESLKLTKLTALDLFHFRMAPEDTKIEAKKKFAALDPSAQVAWIWEAINEYLRQKAKGDNPPTLSVNVNEKRALLKSEGLTDKLPRTLLSFYCHKYKKDGGQHELDALHKSYKEMDQASTICLLEEHIRTLHLYIAKLDQYKGKVVSILSEEEVDDIEHESRVYQKIVKRTALVLAKLKNRKTIEDPTKSVLKVEIKSTPVKKEKKEESESTPKKNRKRSVTRSHNDSLSEAGTEDEEEKTPKRKKTRLSVSEIDSEVSFKSPNQKSKKKSKKT